MKHVCPGLEELAAWAQGPPDDPRLAGARECPRCGARLASLRLFREAAPLPGGGDLREAEARLGLRLERALSEAAKVRALPPRPLAARGRGRALLAAAAVLVACAGLYAVREFARPGPGVVLRDGSAAPGATVRAQEPVWLPDGALRVAWSAAAGADAYAVLLVDAGGRELIRLVAGDVLALDATPADLGAAADATPLFVQVAALRAGDEIARSLPRLVPARPGV